MTAAFDDQQAPPAADAQKTAKGKEKPNVAATWPFVVAVVMSPRLLPFDEPMTSPPQ